MKAGRGLARGSILIPVGLQILCFWVPLLLLLIASFSHAEGGVFTSVGTLANYDRLLQSNVFWGTLRSSILVGLIVSLLTTLLATTLVLACFELLPALVRDTVLVLVAAVFAIGLIPRVFAMEFYLSANGPLASGWQFLGFNDGALYTGIGVVFSYVTVFIPFSTIIIYLSRLSFPQTMALAAKDLGATPRHVIGHVVMPYLRPGLIVSIIVCFILTVADVVVTDLIGGSQIYTVSTFILDLVVVSDWGYASAAAVTTIVVLLLVITGLGVASLRFGTVRDD